MGVKDLWTILSPIGKSCMLSSIEEKKIAIDLSCWICESQNTGMNNVVVEPVLR